MASPNLDQMERRQEKLERLRSLGIDPYPPRSVFPEIPRVHIEELVSIFEAYEVENHVQAGSLMRGQGRRAHRFHVSGRVARVRDLGGAAFVDLRDETGALQIYLKRGYPQRSKNRNFPSLTCQRTSRLKPLSLVQKLVDLGDFVEVIGPVFRTRRGAISIKGEGITILAKALRPPPEKWHGLRDVETRLRQRYLDLISNDDTRRFFRMRSRVVSSVRRFLDERGFLEVETPVLVPIPAGAAAHPFVTHYRALNRDLYLRIATELYLKRLIVGGLEKVYEIGRVFRNEGIDQDHNPEFTLLESYEAYADYQDVMAMVEGLISTVVHELRGTTEVDFGRHVIDFATPWPRIPLLDALHHYAGLDMVKYMDSVVLEGEIRARGLDVEPGASLGRLIDKLVDVTVVPHLIQPTFLVDYPVVMSPLAKAKPEDATLAERFEVFAAGMELGNAFTELNDPREQRRRLTAQEDLLRKSGEEMDRLDEDFLLALEYGMPPTGGLGLGIDRLAMLVGGRESIRDAILFPQLRTLD